MCNEEEEGRVPTPSYSNLLENIRGVRDRKFLTQTVDALLLIS